MTREELYGQMGQTLVGSMDSQIRFREGVKAELQKLARQEYAEEQKRQKQTAADILEKMRKFQYMQPGTTGVPSAPTLPQAPYIAPWTPEILATTQQDYELTEAERKKLSEYHAGLIPEKDMPPHLLKLTQKEDWLEQYKWAALDAKKAADEQRKELQTLKWKSLDYLTKTALLNGADKWLDDFSKTAQFQKLDISQREQAYKIKITELGEFYGVDTDAIQGAFDDPTWQAKVWKAIGGTPAAKVKQTTGFIPNTIRVRIKSTGETGTIPENEFDPNIYEKL